MQSKPNFPPPKNGAKLFIYNDLTGLRPKTTPAKQTQFPAASGLSTALPLEPNPFADYPMAMHGAGDGAAATEQPCTLDREVHKMTEVRPHGILEGETLPSLQVLSGEMLRLRGSLTVGRTCSWERAMRCVDNG
jgi:hypothetical protein